MTFRRLLALFVPPLALLVVAIAHPPAQAQNIPATCYPGQEYCYIIPIDYPVWMPVIVEEA